MGGVIADLPRFATRQAGWRVFAEEPPQGLAAPGRVAKERLETKRLMQGEMGSHGECDKRRPTRGARRLNPRLESVVTYPPGRRAARTGNRRLAFAPGRLCLRGSMPRGGGCADYDKYAGAAARPTDCAAKPQAAYGLLQNAVRKPRAAARSGLAMTALPARPRFGLCGGNLSCCGLVLPKGRRRGILEKNAGVAPARSSTMDNCQMTARRTEAGAFSHS